MKKQRLLGMCMIGMLALAGCGGQAAAEDTGQEIAADAWMQQAKGLLEETDSYMANFRAIVKMSDAEQTTTEASVAFVENPLFMQVDAIISMENAAQSSTTYLVENEGEVDLYMQYNKQWTEMTMDRAAAIKNLQIYHTRDNAIALLAAAQDGQIEQQTGDTIEISALLPEDGFYAVEEQTRLFQLAGLSGLSADYFYDTGDIPIRFTFDQKTQQLRSYEIDLTRALETVTNHVLVELNGGAPVDGIAVEDYVVSSTLTKLGDVEPREIPAEARSSAVNYEEEFYLMAEK